MTEVPRLRITSSRHIARQRHSDAPQPGDLGKPGHSHFCLAGPFVDASIHKRGLARLGDGTEGVIECENVP